MGCCGQKTRIIPINNIDRVSGLKYKPVIDRSQARKTPPKYPTKIDRHRV
jgi:hypothetical protein